MARPWSPETHAGTKTYMLVMVRQALRFGIVGLANTTVGLLTIYAFIYFFDTGPAIANAIGYAIGLVVSFSLNRSWTFGNRGTVAKVLPRYLLIAAISYFLNLIVVLIGTRHFGIGPYLIQIYSACVYSTVFFLGCKWLVFSSVSKG